MERLARREAVSTATVAPAAEPALAERAARPVRLPDNISKWLVGALLVAAAAATIWSTTHAARDCRFKPIALALGADEHVIATVPRGMPCSVRALIGDAGVEHLTIQAPPRHGESAPRGRTGVLYRPDPKFQGEDSFAFALRGRAASAHAKPVVRVRVTVQ